MAEIIMIFDWDGKTIRKDTKGFLGEECVSKTKFLEDALGTSSGRVYKGEFYEEQHENEEQRIKTNN